MKITTEVCKQELDARFPATLGRNVGGWKRLSKTGNAASGFVRLFRHRKLAVTATVTEKDGAIVAVEFADASKAEQPLSAGSQETAGQSTSPSSAAKKPAASNSEGSADQFLFGILNSREGGVTRFAICQIDFWQKHRHLSDDVNNRTMAGLLPEGAYECMESFFECPMKKKALRAFMLAQGFQEDPQFSDYVADVM
ncbi:MAG: hypothetical protein K2W82_16010 [Candidatus Obscuribacterales bacterium]|nr:hypothetical protein [Candidatus Obscuribacterales bacterium]